MTVLADRPVHRIAPELFHEAHTTYGFDGRPVDDATLEAIYEAARMAPTAMNAQPLRILAVRGAAKERLLPHLAEGNRPKSATAPLVVVLAADLDFHDHLPALQPHNPQAGKAFADPEARASFARAQAWLQAGYVILAARAAGLDVGPLGGFDAAGMDREFLADTPWRSFLVINLGYAAPDGQRPRSPRLDTAQAIAWA